MSGKFGQLSIRVDQEILDRIESAIRKGQFASKSDFAYQAILAYLNREEHEQQVKEQVRELLMTDPEIGDALRARCREILMVSLKNIGD